MSRIAQLEALSRLRALDPFETSELIRLIRAEKNRNSVLDRYHRTNEREHRRQRYQTDPAYRAAVLEKNERYRLRRLGRA